MFGLGKPKVLEEVESQYNGKLTVTDGYGDRYVSTGIWTQSGGVIKDVWRPVLKKIAKKDKSWLILGLAAGTAAQMISKKYRPTKIVGVEIDPEMIRIGKQYFDLDKIPNLEIINKSAEHLPAGRHGLVLGPEHYDFVLVDMYQNDQLPNFVYSDKFLDKRMGNIVVFNHLFYSDEMKQNAEKLVTKLRKKYQDVRLMRVLTNLMIICQ